MDPLNIPAKFQVRSFTRSWDNRGYLKKLGPSLDTPTLPFLQNFSWACVRIDPMNVSAKFAVRSFSRSWDNSDCTFGVGCGVANPQSWEEEAVGGRGWYRSKERWWVPIGLRINFSSIFTRFRAIAAFVLQHATFSHPTSGLPQISPYFP